MKENRGITIVALVITIVIMLILLGVTATIAINGELIDTSKKSNDETRYAQILEEKEMWESEKLATNRFGVETETLEDFVKRLEEEKVLTGEEARQVRENGEISIAGKKIVFNEQKNGN